MAKITVKQGGNGIGFFSILALIFITLKLTNFIAWSWLWVLAPLWLPFAIIFGVLAFLLLIVGILSLFTHK